MDSKIRRVLSRLEEQSNKERRGEAQVPAGHEMLAITSDTGAFFSILLKVMRAKRILEIGTSTGYSTLWFADAVTANANRNDKPAIVTVEMNPWKVERAGKNFKDAGVSGLMEVRLSSAMDVLRQLRKSRKHQFDFVFFDADKENLIEYFDLALPMVRCGGIIAVDNMLYPEHFRPHMAKYAKYVRSKRNVQSVTMPIGNGEEITIKLT